MADEASKRPMGFHPDPDGSGKLRWWNGRQWTETYREVVSETTWMVPAELRVCADFADGTRGAELVPLADFTRERIAKALRDVADKLDALNAWERKYGYAIHDTNYHGEPLSRAMDEFSDILELP